MAEDIILNALGSGAGGGIIALLAGFILLAVIVGIVLYIYFALALMAIAKKLKIENAWLAWIPIANLYLMTQISKVPWWTLLIVLFGPVIPIIGALASLGVMIWWWWLAAERLKKPNWWGILMAIPIVNFVIIGILAWGK